MGIISAANGVLSVQNVVEVDTVDLSTGNLEVLGTAIIRKNISDGFSVKTKGDIVVYGNVDMAKLEAEGNIIVSGGIVSADVFANGYIYSNFMTNTKATAYGDVIVGKSILNCNINSNARVICMKGKGAVIGGSVSAKNGVYVRVIGSNSGTQTDIFAGRDIDLSSRYRELIETIKHKKEDIKRLKGALGEAYFKNPKSFILSLPKNRFEAFKASITEFYEVLSETKALEEERIATSKKLETLSTSVVSVADKILPGTIINIVSVRRIIERATSAVEFYYSKEHAMILERAPTILDETEYDIKVDADTVKDS